MRVLVYGKITSTFHLSQQSNDSYPYVNIERRMIFGRNEI